jgi:hypothetical protein
MHHILFGLASSQSSEHRAEDLSAHVLLTRIVIGHDHLSEWKEWQCQAVVHPRQRLDRA